MKTLAAAMVLALATCLILVGEVASAQPAPEFRLGFKTLADQIPTIVGQPVENERHGASGDSLQRTTTGLMAWRKADNWTAFTDGYRTWINGPNGLENRLNGELLSWEGLTLAQLRNAEYRVPLVLQPGRPEQDTPVRLAGGEFALPEQRVSVRLVENVTAHGDLNGDGAPDAVVLLALNTGGSGTFEYAVAVLNRNGSPEQIGHELLGDRVQVNSMAIAGGKITADMIVHGPRDPLCCPTQPEVRVLGIQVPMNPTSFQGTYRANLPAASSAGREVALTLAADGSAIMATDYLGRPPAVIENGTWSSLGSSATVVLTEVNGRPIRTEITFELSGAELVSTTWDRNLYGSVGLRLRRE